jgi:rod shape-determining protein MreC
MPNRKQIRRRRATAVGLVVLSIVLLTVYFSETASGALHSIQRGAMEVLSPLQGLASGAIKPARDGVNWVGDSIHAKGQNDRLKRELVDARIQQARLQQAATENTQLRGLVKFNESDIFPNGRTPVTARVIVRSPTEWFARVTISKGSSSGIRVDQPVIAEGALAGRVTSVTRDASQVTLLTDSSSGVAATVSGKNIPGIVKTGAGGLTGANDLQLTYIDKRGAIGLGDMVVTLGTVSDPTLVRSVFPPGIPIGSVSKVNLEERNLYNRVHIQPFVDMHDIQIVEVLTRKGGG